MGYAKSLIVRAGGKADGSSSLKDEVFGTTPVGSDFVLEAVVPASDLTATGNAVTAHVTAYTQAMSTMVANKLGQSDIDAAIALARTQVSVRLTNGADPLTTSPTSLKMLALLASVSNIAMAATSTSSTDPYACAGKSGNEAKIACTIKTIQACCNRWRARPT